MSQSANHAEGHVPQGHEHPTRVPRNQYLSVQQRYPIRMAGAEAGFRAFAANYVPQSPEVARYEAQQRNLGQVATTQQYNAQPARYYAEPPANYAQPAVNVEPVTPTTPTTEVAMGNGITTTQDTVDYLTQEVNDAMAPADIAATTGLDIETLRQQIRNMS